MEFANALDEYARASATLIDAVALVRADQLDRAASDGWTPRQIVHHVADSETQSYVRLRRLVAEPPGSLIQGYDEAAWAECAALGYRELPIAGALQIFSTVRAASLDVLARLGPDDFDRYGEHSESGRYTIAQWLDIYTRHPLEHTRQLHEALGDDS